MKRRNWFRGKHEFERNMNDELRDHIDRQTEANLAAGMTAEEARRHARMQLGAIEGLKEDCREERHGFWLEAIWSNVRYGFRMMGRAPGFAAVVVLTLALGIGANSAVFSAIDAILLKPLPFPNGDQLMRIDQYNPRVKAPQSFVAPARLEDWNHMNSTFQAITGYYFEDATETTGPLPEKLTEVLVAPRFFQVFGVAPILGREFAPEEEHFGGPTSAVISNSLWRRRFDGNANVIGKKLRIGSWSYVIVGVMPASFIYPVRDVDFWAVSAPDAPYARDRNSTWFTVVGRLKTGITLSKARADLATVQGQLGRQYPKPDAELAVRVDALKEATIGGVRSSLWILFGSVSLLLLIACTNIVALLLARAPQREQEISVRVSLGASPRAIVGQLLTEVFVMALSGAILGLLVAGLASRVFCALAADLPRVEEIHLDARIVAYALITSVVVTMLCGLLPAVRGARRSIAGSLAQSSRTQVSGRHPLQWLLVGVQVALAVTLLAGAGLLFRSFRAIGEVSPGFEIGHILTFHVSASWGETAEMKTLIQRIDRMIESLRGLPGVDAAATAAQLPGVSYGQQTETELKFSEGQIDASHKMFADVRFVSPSYFATMKIPLLSGDACREQPNRAEIVVNRTFANEYGQNSSVMGRHLEQIGAGFIPAGEIRGIVGDAREDGLNREPGAVAYWCYSAPLPDPYYLVRTKMEPMALAETVRQELHKIEPGRSVFDLSPLSEHLDETFAENRLRMVLLGFFAATAVSLACVGLYGTLSYSVNVRQREIGLRLALGAVPKQIVKQFLVQGLLVCTVGSAAGWALSAASGRLLSDMLYGVSPTDAATIGTVVFTVLVVATFASLVPAVRASRVEPMRVLRNE